MGKKQLWSGVFCGGVAGIINGLFGAGGGMVLVPLLQKYCHIPDDKLFPTSVSIILPISLVSLSVHLSNSELPFRSCWPYLLGGCVGGVVAAFTGKKIPVKWLHRILGAMILWGGVKYLC